MSIGALQIIVRKKSKSGLLRVLKILAGTSRMPISSMELKTVYEALYTLNADDKKLRAAIETESTDDWAAIGTRVSKEKGLIRNRALAHHWVKLIDKVEVKPDQKLLIARQRENNARRKAA